MMAKNEFKAKCVMTLRCFWQDLSTLYHSTSLQPWLSIDSKCILHYTAAMSRNNNEHCLNTSAQTQVTLLYVYSDFIVHTHL